MAYGSNQRIVNKHWNLNDRGTPQRECKAYRIISDVEITKYRNFLVWFPVQENKTRIQDNKTRQGFEQKFDLIFHNSLTSNVLHHYLFIEWKQKNN